MPSISDINLLLIKLILVKILQFVFQIKVIDTNETVIYFKSCSLIVCLLTLSVTQTVALIDVMLVNNELERM
jgi:hypothetical protein